MFQAGRIAALCVVILWLPWGSEARATPEDAAIRVGVLQFGTMNWEMDVIRRHQLAEKQGLKLETVPLASVQALLTALQGGAVDVIVGDWIWAARQRQLNRSYSFVPYSTMAASVIVAPDSGITNFEQLRHKRIGVAGGPVNKSWILYRAFARRQYGMDLMKDTEIKFAAPPILNALMLKGELDAVINFWHFSSELVGRGLTPILNMEELLIAFDIKGEVPLLGWLFHTDWALENRDRLNQFLATSQAARELMLRSDAEWEAIEPMQQIKSVSLRRQLRDDYRAGIPGEFSRQQVTASRQLFNLLREEGGEQVVGSIEQLPDDLFWKSLPLVRR